MFANSFEVFRELRPVNKIETDMKEFKKKKKNQKF